MTHPAESAPCSPGVIPGPKLRLILAATGASGSIFAAEMLRALDADARVAKVDFIPSEASLRVFAEEMQLSGRNALAEKLLGHASTSPSKIIQHAEADIGASIASGSYAVDSMVVIPCTTGCLAQVAHGISDTLIERAADVCLKESRKLVLAVRDAPFNQIHLKNMLRAQTAGAVIFPIIPSFYHRPKTLDDLVTQFCCRVLAQLGLEQADQFRWRGLGAGEGSGQ